MMLVGLISGEAQHLGAYEVHVDQLRLQLAEFCGILYSCLNFANYSFENTSHNI
jgi:hypothetical protein